MRKTARSAAVALTAGIVLAGTVAAAQAAPAAPATPECGPLRAAAAHRAVPAAAAPGDGQVPEASYAATSARKVSFTVANAQAPIGLWSKAALTLRTPVAKGTVRLDLASRGFSTDSVTVQRYVPAKHTWVDLDSRPGSGSWPHRGTLTFPVSAKDASPRHPHSVALRFQDLDRPGRLTVNASVTDGHGRTLRAPARTVIATRPQVSVSGWQGTPSLARGGAAQTFTLKVRNTTNRTYPALNVNYFAYGAGKQHALTPKDLLLQQYRPGRGWEKVNLTAGGCDPGMGAALRPGKRALAPGATAVYRLRLSVAKSAPRDVVRADSGVSVNNGDQSFFSRRLLFAIHGK
ncbi:hypothetical protein I5Q34_27020 [Streptomyces sp. AV19]|uniref:hypothetical protein n=1 Tax=Streptomyces sp. AV19 TaxID=2793068 RepID=UPI0018FEB752|nr:hypothetical protein [Streptomyces sp. AV19]MBH1937878.1 hypothetical protein [Streptomyces sp. AV19]MDG4536523.1 hypothetical protein [Streptomyces sp. AV19]